MKDSSNKTIGVFFGSRSPEHDVSIITACLAIGGLRTLGFNVVPIYISKDGTWFIHEDLGNLDFYQDPTYRDALTKYPEYRLSLDFASPGMTFEKKSLIGGSKITIDIAFPCFHGPNGEDGTMQGIFEIAQIPYVGCAVTTSAVTMDKVLTKEICVQHSIPTAEFVYFSRTEWGSYKEDIIKQVEDLGYPVFVKPPRAGSSIGITQARNAKQLEGAINVALKFDHKVLVEKGVSNLADLTVAVIGNHLDPGNVKISEIQESRFSDDFFTYEEKYLSGGGAQLGNATKNTIIPAEIDEKTTDTIKAMAQHIFVTFECSGISRVDFLYDRTSKKVYANEINTLPGTLYHHLWKQSGVSLGELLRTLVRLAEESFNARNSLTYSFSSGILKHVGAGKLSKKM